VFGAGVTTDPYLETQTTKKFSQEVRYALPIAQRIDWLLGAFYTDEKSSPLQKILAVNPTTNAVAGEWVSVVFPTHYQEIAAFTDVTFRLSDQFDIQVGGRASQNKQKYSQDESGLLVGGTPIVITDRQSKADSYTYLVAPRYKFSPDMMVYARLASGYQPGGPNTALGGGTQFEPSKTRNYEVGVKGDVLDHKISFDASAYYIDWSDIQLTLVSSLGGYKVNGSGAKSQGVELSTQFRPWDGLTIAAWTAYSDAVLTEAFAPNINAIGASGDRLPFTNRFSGNVSVDQEFSLPGSAVGYIGSSLSYVGDSLSIFTTGARQRFPAYAKTDVHGGVKLNTWTVNLFANNVTDRRAALSGGLGSFNPNAFVYIQPRTIGINVIKAF
jgi:iron complex outermembrane receptor protein